MSATAVEHPFAIPIKHWADQFGISEATAHRMLKGEDPPPNLKVHATRRIAVGHPDYAAWLNRQMNAG